MSDFMERIMKHEIDSINNHLPKTCLSLRELLAMERPAYETRAGERSTLIKSELERIAIEVPERYHEDIRLPIVILRRMDLGPGMYTLTGGKIVLFLIHRLLGYVDLVWEEISNWKPVDRIARPQVQMIRRLLPSTTCIGFVGGEQI